MKKRRISGLLHLPQQLFPGCGLRAAPIHLTSHDLTETVARQQKPAVRHHHRHLLRLRDGPVNIRRCSVELVRSVGLRDVAVLHGDVESVARHDQLADKKRQGQVTDNSGVQFS